MAASIRVIANEFATLYAAGDRMAQLAYRQMNYYKDVKTENGTETDKLMGEFFLNLPADEKIVQVFMEGNMIAVANLVSLLAIGISGEQGKNLSAKIAEKYAIKDTLTHEEYHETASSLGKNLEITRGKLLRYDALSEQYDITDDNMTNEEYNFMSNYASLALLMNGITYGETTFADFVREGTWKTQDLYPFVAALTEGQKALVELGQLDVILQYNSPSKHIDELVDRLCKSHIGNGARHIRHKTDI
jgi:hypothetical protein